MYLQFITLSTGMSIVCKDELKVSNVRYLIIFHILINCSIFCIFIIVLEHMSLFSRFIADARCMRCWILNSLTFMCSCWSYDLSIRSFHLISTNVNQLVLIGEKCDETKKIIYFWTIFRFWTGKGLNFKLILCEWYHEELKIIGVCDIYCWFFIQFSTLWLLLTDLFGWVLILLLG